VRRPYLNLGDSPPRPSARRARRGSAGSLRIAGAFALLVPAVAACTPAAKAPEPAARPSLAVGAQPALRLAPPLAAPGDPPRIVSVWLSKTEFAPGERIAGRIVTTTNVASLEIRVEGYGRVIPRTDFGRFEGSVAVPKLPSFLRRAFTLQILARNAGGIAAKTTVPIRVL
jgi:hypothetical protein